jgi:hypothetical protein
MRGWVQIQIRSPSPEHLKMWAAKVGMHTLHVLFINNGPQQLRVSSQLPATAPAKVERLLAPVPSSRFGVTLGGQRLNEDARRVGARHRRSAPGSSPLRREAPTLQRGAALSADRARSTALDDSI